MKNGLLLAIVAAVSPAAPPGRAENALSAAPELQVGAGYRRLADINSYGGEATLGVEIRNKELGTCGLLSLQGYFGRTTEGLSVTHLVMESEYRARFDALWLGFGFGFGQLLISRKTDTNYVRTPSVQADLSFGFDFARGSWSTWGVVARIRTVFPMSWGPTLALLARF